jgi:ribonuclease P protein component
MYNWSGLFMKFRKSERLCSRKSIGRLFTSGNVSFHYPFRVHWLEAADDSPFPAKAVIAVPRKSFRRAVERNRIKRIIREAYRLNKEELYNGLRQRDRNIDMIIIYIATGEHDYNFINERIIILFQKLLNDAQGDQENG